MKKPNYIQLTLIILLLFGQIQAQDLKSDTIRDTFGQPFTGLAWFKFVIANDSISVWSNDGSSHRLEEPKNAVEIRVVQGIYKANLGQFPMLPIFDEVMQLYPPEYLYSWVDIGNGLIELPIKPMTINDLSDFSDQTATNEVKQTPQLVKPDNFKKREKKQPKDKSATNPDERYKQWFMQHADAKGNIPFDGLVKAKEHVDKMPQTRDAGIWNWEWLGPGNIGGRIRAIAIKPDNADIIFIGSASGGLWKTTNGGTSWSVVNDFLPSLAISSIVYDPTNLNTMYASTGEGNGLAKPGAGIFKSTDSGSTWTQLASTNNNNFKLVFRLAHHQDSTGVLYATTYDPPGVWKTNNGGTTWTEILNPPFFTEDIKISPHNPAHLLVGAYGGAFRSTDYGHTWDTLTNNDTLNGKLPRESFRCEISFCQSNPNRIYLSMQRNDGKLYRSDDNGVNWVLKNGTTSFFRDGGGNQGNYDQALWVNPTNSNHVVVGGIDLWTSTDGGNTFSRLSKWQKFHNNSDAYSAHSDQHVIISHPGFDAVNNKTIFVGNDGGIQRNDDVFDTLWTNLAGTTLGISQFYGGAASPDGQYITGGAQDNDQLRYKASGDWSGAGGWFQSETGDGGFCAIDYNNSQIQYAEYVRLKIEKSTDGGTTYRNSFTGLIDAVNEYALFIAPFIMDPNSSGRLIAGSYRIWETDDSASTWHLIGAAIDSNKYCSALDIAKQNSNILWAGYTNGTLMVSTNSLDGTPVWTKVDDNGPLPNRYVTDISINPNNFLEVYITFGGYNADNIWFTADGGTTWSNRSGVAPNDLPAIQVNTIRVHPRNSNWVYAGTDIGVFASEDKGLNWAVDPRYAGQGNEIPANVEVYELFWQGTDYLVAATHGRGMYRALPLYTIYVDKNASPGGNGSESAPYQTVLEAANAAGPGAVVSVESNTYDEGNILFSRKVRVITTNGGTIIK